MSDLCRFLLDPNIKILKTQVQAINVDGQLLSFFKKTLGTLIMKKKNLKVFSLKKDFLSYVLLFILLISKKSLLHSKKFQPLIIINC
jgi:hypothetical protein